MINYSWVIGTTFLLCIKTPVKQSVTHSKRFISIKSSTFSQVQGSFHVWSISHPFLFLLIFMWVLVSLSPHPLSACRVCPVPASSHTFLPSPSHSTHPSPCPLHCSGPGKNTEVLRETSALRRPDERRGVTERILRFPASRSLFLLSLAPCLSPPSPRESKEIISLAALS